MVPTLPLFDVLCKHYVECIEWSSAASQICCSSIGIGHSHQRPHNASLPLPSSHSPLHTHAIHFSLESNKFRHDSTIALISYETRYFLVHLWPANGWMDGGLAVPAVGTG